MRRARSSLRYEATLARTSPVSQASTTVSGGARRTDRTPWALIRIVFALFVAAIPFEGLDLGLGSISPSRLMGWVLFALALLQPTICFRRPRAAVWCFVVFIAVFGVLGLLRGSVYLDEAKSRIFLLAQMLALTLIASNLLRYRQIFLGTLHTFVGACVLLSVLQLWGVTSAAYSGQRETAFEEDPNNVAAILALGLVAAVGVGYGRSGAGRFTQAVAWVCFGTIGLGVVRTGSRGPFVALAVGIAILVLRRGSAWIRVRNMFIVVAGLSVLIAMASSSETARQRWELTYEKGSLAGREKIYPVAWRMFLERPVLGWGVGTNLLQLGHRLGEGGERDTHNVYLWVLTEDGLIGGIPVLRRDASVRRRRVAGS